MKMKKILSLILVVITVLSVSSFAVSAETTTVSGNSVAVTTVNNNDYSYKIRLAIVEKLVDVTNARIMALVNTAISQENPDISKLVAKTNALAQNTINIASFLGITVVCDYTPYVINGQTVYIDPLIVIRR